MIKTSKLKTATVIALLALVTVIALVLISKQQQAEAPQTPESDVMVDEKPAPPVVKLIRLPNAEPVTPIDGDYSAEDHLWKLVNKQSPLGNNDYRPAELQLITPSWTAKSNDERSVSAVMTPDLMTMLADAKLARHDLMVGSGYRSYALQNTYYSSYVRANGEAQANQVSAKPGQSEHQTGLAVDLAYQNQNCYLKRCFADTAAGKWLAEHAHEYGFILRYPLGKETITGYIYEPWHFRYLGKELATAVHQSGLTYEEAQTYINSPE